MKAQSKKDIISIINGFKVDFGVLLLICCAVFFALDYIKYNDIKDVVSTLQNLSAAIFTIVGLWVGFLYPNAIQSIVSDNVDYIKNSKDAPRIEKLIYVIITSALVMLSTLFFYVVKSFLGGTPIYKDNMVIIKFGGLGFLSFMCWLQTKCVFSLIISNLNFVNNLHTRINNSKIKHGD